MSSSSNMPAFDPERYKATTREQWDTAAQAWHNWAPTLQEWQRRSCSTWPALSPQAVSSTLLRALRSNTGRSETRRPQRFRAGNRHFLENFGFAQQNALSKGYNNISTRVLDGENLDVEAGSFDAAISRVGLIYFPDQQKALSGIRKVLKPGGRLGANVYSTAERNQFFSIPVSIIRRHANLPPPAPGQPGPFSLGGDGVPR